MSSDGGMAENDIRRALAGQAFTLQVRYDEKEAI
jgi:hypothetical protein